MSALNTEHPNDLDLLAIAFPDRGRSVNESVAMHVLCCPICMENVMNMREMDSIMSAQPLPFSFSPIINEPPLFDVKTGGIPYHRVPSYGNDCMPACCPPPCAAAAVEISDADAGATVVNVAEYLDMDATGTADFAMEEEATELDSFNDENEDFS